MTANKNLKPKSKQIIVVLILALLIVLAVTASMAFTPQLLAIAENPETFREWIDRHGILSRLVMVVLVMIKVILPFIPGKPFEIGAGFAFGIIEGAILCLIGAALGSYVVFLLVRTVGVKIFNLFYPREKLLSLGFLKNTEKLSVWVFFIMLIPGTPKDFISYFVGLTNIKFRTWLVISPLARIPVVLMSTLGGNALGTQDYHLALIVFAVTVLISAGGLIAYNFIQKKKSRQGQKNANK